MLTVFHSATLAHTNKPLSSATLDGAAVPEGQLCHVRCYCGGDEAALPLPRVAGRRAALMDMPAASIFSACRECSRYTLP